MQIMKRKLFSTTTAGALLLSVFALGPRPAALSAEEPVTFAPPIRSVIVYPDRALVTRSAAVDLPRGKHVLVFREASPNLEPASLRAFSDSRDLIIQGINSYVERSVATRDPEVRRLEDRLDELERRQEGLALHRTRLDSDLAGVEQYSNYFSRMIAAGSTGRASAEETARWDRARGFLNQRKTASAAERRAVDRQIEEVREKLTIARRDLGRLKTANAKAVRIVEITLNARDRAGSRVGFSYMMRGASWNVSYGMYMKDRRRVRIEYYGNIRQKTGEDWQNVTLRLSTSTPAHGAERPKLGPLAVGARRVQTELQIQQQEQTFEETEGEEPVPSDGTTAADSGADRFTKVEGDGTSLVFRVARPVTMASGERNHRVSVSHFETDPRDFHYRLAPGVRRTAVLAARIANEQAFPLLAGSVDVYRASGFIGRSRIKYVPPGSTFLMGFGAERSIRVQRSVKRYRDESGVLSSTKRFHTKVTVEVKNEGDSERKITLFERVPVSDLEEVAVTILPETSAGHTEAKKNSGLRKWELSLGPGQKREFVLSYRVDVPASFPGSYYGK